MKAGGLPAEKGRKDPEGGDMGSDTEAGSGGVPVGTAGIPGTDPVGRPSDSAALPAPPRAGNAQGLIQGELFTAEDAEGVTRGYRGTVAADVAGITYRQLDYWARKRILEPSINPSHGSGSRRLYSFKDVVILCVLKRLLDAGVNLQNATRAVRYLVRQTKRQLARVTIVCDGEQVVECSSADQVFSLMKTGRAVFAISVSAIYKRMDDSLRTQDHVDLATGEMESGLPKRPIDEITAMRIRHRLEEQHEMRARAGR